ncbi:G patch domain-containing protein 1 homolog [Nymphalis io]|uniref:G patch domain-containing protein 1 homolog n=1 Tax=Inachis io TaxID=171585 RepID=UPI00216984DD|nr:G patch domain-containing protein 1 homolog [Nymphalis io]
MSGDDSDEENLIRYGTPLEPFEEDEVPSKRKFQQQPDQYAVDEHGRRRFHGAFTGGFSAGYGNTVGTPEGWAPSSFKSSRLEKAQISNQRPEDFMDEEDRSEFGIAPRNLQTKNEFSGQKRPHQQRYHDGPIPGEPVLEQFIRAVHETTAVKMLRRMGWKEGQGVGDRVTRREKKRAKDQHKVYGCYMPTDIRQETKQSDESSDSEFEYDTLFAPDDYDPYILQHKSDRFGIGYKGLSRHSVLGNLVGEYGGAGSSKSHLLMNEKGKKVSIRGQAFGVGAFEADDDDVFGAPDMSHYDREAGGAADEPPRDAPGSCREPRVLEGFVRATKPPAAIASYPPPALPRDYTPAPAGVRRSRFEPTAEPQRDQGLGRHDLTSEARGALLGEKPIPKIEEQDTNTQTQNTEVTKVLEKTINFVTENTQKDKEIDFISIKDSGKEINVFKPFVSDPKKQARYERYLQGDSTIERDGATGGDRLSDWERNREMAEFEQAAKLYRPLSGIMGDRFTHASEPDDGALNPLSAVAKSSINYGLATPEQIEAAKMGAYGVITRREVKWRPEPLVCKRFNVPELGERIETKKDDKPKVSYSIFSYLESSVHDKESFTREQSKFSGSKSLNVDHGKTPKKDKEIDINPIAHVSKPIEPVEANTGHNKRMTVAELFMKECEKDLQIKNKETEVVQTIEKFDRMDLYKSIFLSDSENEETNEENTSTDYKEFIEKPKNVERNTSPPRGIFANIDFDELNSWKRNAEDKNPKTNEKSVENNVSESKIKTSDNTSEKIDKNDDKQTNDINNSIVVEEAVYGPKIPENLLKRLEQPETNFKPKFRTRNEREREQSSSSDSWVEAKVKSKKEKKKKSKKHKTKKKSKHKKKDK